MGWLCPLTIAVGRTYSTTKWRMRATMMWMTVKRGLRGEEERRASSLCRMSGGSFSMGSSCAMTDKLRYVNDIEKLRVRREIQAKSR